MGEQMVAKKRQRTIAVDTATMERLSKHGRFKDSYCSIINRLLDSYELKNGSSEAEEE